MCRLFSLLYKHVNLYRLILALSIGEVGGGDIRTRENNFFFKLNLKHDTPRYVHFIVSDQKEESISMIRRGGGEFSEINRKQALKVIQFRR